MPARARTALLGAAIFVAIFLATWYAAFHVALIARADRAILSGFTGLGQKPRVGTLAWHIATLCDPKPYVFLCIAPLAVALLRRRLWLALAIGAILLGANVTTQLLKPLLAEPHPDPLNGAGILTGSYPSGHATAAMSLALCCVLAVPGRLRPYAAALGAAFAVAVSYSFLSLEWHYPSDVLGGFLVASIWTLVAIAAILTADARRLIGPSRGLAGRPTVAEALGPPAAAFAAAVVLAGLVLIAKPQAVVAYASAHRPFVIGAAAIGLLGMALSTGIMLALRR